MRLVITGFFWRHTGDDRVPVRLRNKGVVCVMTTIPRHEYLPSPLTAEMVGIWFLARVVQLPLSIMRLNADGDEGMGREIHCVSGHKDAIVGEGACGRTRKEISRVPEPQRT